MACPTPLGDGRFFLTGGSGATGSIFQVTHHGTRWECRTLVKDIACASSIQTPLCDHDCLYVNSGNSGKGLLCLDLQGRIIWQHHTTPALNEGGALLLAGELLYFTHGKSGTLYLASVSASACTELAAAPVLAPGNNWAPMALVDGRLLVRDAKRLHCYDISS